jgi:CBS-domain-containing membrane protein
VSTRTLVGVDTDRVADHMATVHTTHGAGTTVAEVREYLADDHVHMALIVDPDGRLLTAIERADLDLGLPGDRPARGLGTLRGRTVGPADRVGPLTELLRREGRRRLAVVDERGRLVGLLCFKRSGTGYCSDEGILARARERREAGNRA